jgi:hypothetical protein
MGKHEFMNHYNFVGASSQPEHIRWLPWEGKIFDNMTYYAKTIDKLWMMKDHKFFHKINMRSACKLMIQIDY